MKPQQRRDAADRALTAQTVGFTTALTKAMASTPTVPEVATATSCTSSTCSRCTACKKGGKR